MDAGVIEPSELTIQARRPNDGGGAGEGALVLALGGRLSVETAPAAWSECLARVAGERPRTLVVDISGLDYCDGSGATLLLHLERGAAARGGSAEITGANPDIARLLDHYRAASSIPLAPRRERHRSFREQIGAGAIDLAFDVRDLVAFVGEITLGFHRALRRPKQVRWTEIMVLAEGTGFDALPIITLLGFLIGLILAFQSAIPLRAYGADLYVANLLGLSLLRELGPLLTAVILAGRSGAAFAAEIGTMKVQEEIDALKTMGLDPMLFLVVPRTVAAVLMMPLLTIFLDLCGLAGGAVVMRGFGITPVAFVRQLLTAVQVHDLVGGLAKSLVFGVLVAGIGCYRGLATGKGPSAVGASTTSAVVSGIVLIILADGVFAVVYYVLGL